MRGKVFHPDPMCFGCGKENPCGLQIEAEVSGEKVVGTLRIKESFKGFGKISHGGPLMSALDEVMSYIPFLKGNGVYLTEEIRFKFIKGVPIGKELLIEAVEKTKDERSFVVEGIMRDREGNIYIKAEGTFRKIDTSKIKEYS